MTYKLEEILNTVIQGDCLKVMRDLPDKSIDLVLTDPPYGINFQSNSAKVKRHDVLANDDNFDLNRYWSEIERIVKDGGAIYVFCRWDIAYKWQEIIKPDSQIIISRGRVSMGDLNDYSDEYEVILYKKIGKHIIDATSLKIKNNSHMRNPPEFKSRIGNLWTDVKCNEAWERTDHPTQKTVSSMAKIIRISTKESDTILDPFLGSGTTAVAAKQLGRKFIGIEISPKYVAIANERLRQGILI